MFQILEKSASEHVRYQFERTCVEEMNNATKRLKAEFMTNFTQNDKLDIWKHINDAFLEVTNQNIISDTRHFIDRSSVLSCTGDSLFS